VNIRADVCGLQFGFYFTQIIDFDLTENDLVRRVKPIVDIIEQQGGHNNNDRRADDKKDSAHERGI